MKIELGDIFEIQTSKGTAYLHYVFKDERIGELVRVLPGLYSDQLENLEALAAGDELFYVFFPLAAAKRKKIVKKAGHYSIGNFTRPEYMRIELFIGGNFLGWHIVETNNWHRQLTKELDENHKKLSPWGVWNDSLLIERLEEGWTLDSWIPE